MRDLVGVRRPKDIPARRDAGGIEVPRILRLVQRGPMLPWLRWWQQFDLPVCVSTSTTFAESPVCEAIPRRSMNVC